MNIRDLKYLVALAEHRHFSKAAEACFVSQPGLSMQIKKLEDTLGVSLVERLNSGKSVLLTAIGVKIAEKAARLLHQVQDIQELAKSAKDPARGELKLGLIPTLAPYLLPHMMPSITKAFPYLSLYLLETKTEDLLEKLKTGKIEAAILALPVADPNFVVTPLFEEEFFLAVPSHHALNKRKSVKISHLQDKTLLLLEEGHCLREQALAVCHTAQASEMKYFQATSLETLRHMIQSGIGMTLMPKLACKENKDIAYIPFNAPQPSRTIVMLWRNSTVKESLLTQIAQHIKTAKKLQEK